MLFLDQQLHLSSLHWLTTSFLRVYALLSRVFEREMFGRCRDAMLADQKILASLTGPWLWLPHVMVRMCTKIFDLAHIQKLLSPSIEKL